MPNHIHLLIERREDSISRIMQRLLTGYAQYYNRSCGAVGHLLQGRYKAILCDTDQYLAELVRYIHLNPVRAKLARMPEDWPWSGHRAYIGVDQSKVVDTDPLLRRFGAKKREAQERYARFVRAGRRLGHIDEFYRVESGRILGGEEFIDATIHRIGESDRRRRKRKRVTERKRLNVDDLVKAAVAVTGISRDQLCSRARSEALVLAKEAVVFVGRQKGLTNAEISTAMGLDASVVSRRYESGRSKMGGSQRLRMLIKRIIQDLRKRQ
jgi:hypothetical protein